MSVIAALFIEKLAFAAAAEGLNAKALMRATGLNADALDPTQMVPSDAHYSLWERIMRELGSCGFPIRYATTIRADDYGVFGLALKTAPHLAAAWQRASKYLLMMTNSSWLELREGHDTLQLLFRREGQRDLGMRCANEAAIAEMVAVSREISGFDVVPRRVCFRHKKPHDIREHERFFRCKIEFLQEVDAIELDARIFQLPASKADAGLSQFVLDHLERVGRTLPDVDHLQRSLKRIVCDALPGGAPSMAAMAKQLGMSKRTLQRRLSENGTTFQSLVEDTRQELAAGLLRQTSQPLLEIAFLLGFSEQSAFQRAFKRWTGRTPAEYRSAAT
jgi:AraC-like DNA-binding protein